MSDPQNFDPSDDLFQNRIAAALRNLELPESDADLEIALDSVTPEPLDEPLIRRVMFQVQAAVKTASPELSRQNSHQADLALARSAELSMSRISKSRDRRSNAPIVAACLAALSLVGLLLLRSPGPVRHGIAIRTAKPLEMQTGELISANDRDSLDRDSGSARNEGPKPAGQVVQIGTTISTGAREKRRVTLPDGSVLSINANSKVTVTSARRLKLHRGEIFAEVIPAALRGGSKSRGDRFVVETPHRTVTALGTKFDVKAEGNVTDVVVTQGKVQVSGVDELVSSGQELIADGTESKSTQLRPAKRSAYVVDWVKDLIVAAGAVVVPPSEHAGGAITVIDPQGQEMKLSLRKFHVDVHIEDGFARTTIDQTYFNHTWQQLEGTFRFPLPADASLSRLAMYVNGKLMEGGMVERDHGRNVFEQIRHTRRDPALLEWVDGTTFQMRVFPLEARQEKRILLSYTQRLPNDYGKAVYRFPAGHSLEGVGEWSTLVRVKGGVGSRWYSPSHLLSSREEKGDLILEGREEYASLDQDLVVELSDSRPGATEKTEPDWSVYEQDGALYALLRVRPDLKATSDRARRHWIFVVENSADRNEILASTQRQIIKVLLENVEHTDSFSLIRAGTQATEFRPGPVECTAENLERAQEFLKDVAPIGALDLEQALNRVAALGREERDTWIIHLGTGIPVLGERDPTTLQRLLPQKARYVGVAVGKRWSKSFMQSAATRSGGYVAQINPDESVPWRAFDLLSTLSAPRLTEIAIQPDADKSPDFLLLTTSLAHGQQLAAITRFVPGEARPKTLTITGQLNGTPYSLAVPVPSSIQTASFTAADESGPRVDATATSQKQRSSRSGHLPRTWARLEIDRLVSLGADEHKARIIELSKAMSVMSPFTSLLVLETEEMYEQFKVDRGRKDHWALYPAPEQIPVSPEVIAANKTVLETAQERLKLAQSRLKTAEANLDRGRTDHRSVEDVKRLERILNTEQADIQRIEAEITRIERSNEAAADPVFRAWRSVIQRRNSWSTRYHLMDLGWNNLDLSKWQSTPFKAYGGGFGGAADDSTFQFLGEIPGQFLGPVGGSPMMNGGQLLQSFPWGRTTFWSDQYNTKGLDLSLAFTANDGRYLLEDSTRSWHGPVSLRYQFQNGIQPFGTIPISESVAPNGGSMPGLVAASGINMSGLIPWTNSAGNGRSMSIAGDSLPSAYYLDDDVQYFPFPFGIRGDVEEKLRKYRTGNSDSMIPGNRVDFVPPLALLNQGVHGSQGLFFDFEELPSQGRGIRSIREMGRAYSNFYGVFDGTPLNLSYYRTGVPIVRTVHPLEGIVTDLPSYAPAMQTWPSDRLAVTEAAAAQKPARGQVEDGARRLIEKSRSRGWERIRRLTPLPSANKPGWIIADGQGRFVMEREVSEGLKETVVCDQQTLWNLYPEIGLGAKRSVSRYLQPAIQGLIPWYVPSADDLSVGADIKLVGDRTIRVIPLKTPDSDPGKEWRKHGPAPSNPSIDLKRQIAIELVFALDGRLQQTTVFNTRTGDKLVRQVCAENGTVRLFDGDDHRLSEVNFERLPVEAPELVPQVGELVVLPLPYRSAADVDVSVPVNLQTNAPDFARLSEEDAMKLLATYFAEDRVHEMGTLIEQRLLKAGERRPGLAVLLSSVYPNSPLVTTPALQDPDSPLSRFIHQLNGVVVAGSLEGTMDAGPEAGQFLKRICGNYNYYSRWASGRAAASGRPVNDVQTDLDATLGFLRDCRSLDLATILLKAVHDALSKTNQSTPGFARQLNEFAARLADERGYRGFCRSLRIEWLLQIGDQSSEARALELLRDDFADALSAGVVPEVLSDVHTAFVRHFKTENGQPCDPWCDILMASASELIQKKQPIAAIELARRCIAVNEQDLVAKILDRVMKDQVAADPFELNLSVLKCAKEAGFWERAAAAVRQVLQHEQGKNIPRFWRDAAEISLHRQKFEDSVNELERASELEFASLPKSVNLQAFRQSYEELFTRFEERTEQLLQAGAAEKASFARQIQRAAGRWRSIDTNDTICCHRTAKMMTKLGLATAAWSYWTTPLANSPDQSAAWIDFAVAMNSEQRFNIADKAWSTAFQCESTNPDILLQHAQFLRSTNQTQRSREILTRITTSTWQPRFEGVKNQAQLILNGEAH